MAKLERLNRQDPDERLPQYAGKRVRYVHVVLEMVDRKPVRIVMAQYSYFSFDSAGRIDADELQKELRLGVDMLPPLTTDRPSRKIIDAQHKFAKKRYHDQYSWTPTPEIEAAIIKAIFDKG